MSKEYPGNPTAFIQYLRELDYKYGPFDPETPDDGLDEVPLEFRRKIYQQAKEKITRPLPPILQDAR